MAENSSARDPRRALAAGARLGPYEILAPIGAGGMGEVYRARDRKLERDVAIKVLPAHLSASPEALGRFEREARAVAALSHPNILSIFDFGTHDGVAYAVTELLEGETLREKLDAGPISQKWTVDYGLQIAKGLSAAHERGVVHRDLKPENLFVTRDGHLKILDFGLAKRDPKVAAGDETTAPTVSGHTEPGTVMGTVGYMSPEQVRGLSVDHRSDIFSFGAVLYELLSGRRAFKKDTAADTMSAILKEEPPELSQSGRSVPVSLDHVVKHCLEKDPNRRFQSAHDIAFALSEASDPTVASGKQLATAGKSRKRLFIAAAAVALIGIAAFLLVKRSAKIEIPAIKRVAVLPFENLGAPEDDYFADGMADEIRGKLTSLPGVEVIARASSTPYRKTTKTPQEIARELGVGYLLTATVQWQKTPGASRVVVRPELVEITSVGAPKSKWQQPFDAAMTDVFQVQSDIASRTAHALGLALRASEVHRLAATPTGNLAAYDAFLKGEQAYWGLDQGRKALGFYEQAVALDPGFAHAWANLSIVSSWLYGTETPTVELAERARTGAERAMVLAPDGAEGYHAFGTYQFLVLEDLSRGLELVARAQRLAPSSSNILVTRGAIEVNLGRLKDAMEHYRRAERLDPRSVDPKIFIGAALLNLRRYPEAREVLDRGLVLEPAHLVLIGTKAMTYLYEGDLKGARAVLQAASGPLDQTRFVAFAASFVGVLVLDEGQMGLLARLTPGAFDDNRASWAMCLAEGHALQGDTANARVFGEEAREALEEQLRVAPKRAKSHADLGRAFAYLGRKEEAVREAERAIALVPFGAWNGAWYRFNLAVIYAQIGEQEKALDQLEPVVRSPYGPFSPAWLTIDPNLDSLRGNPRFERLVAGK